MSTTRNSRTAGRKLTRRGFMARVRLQRFGQGNIYPHEETHAAAKADRLKLTMACRANLSQIFGLYPDRDNEAQLLLENRHPRMYTAGGHRPPGRRPPLVAGDRRHARSPRWLPHWAAPIFVADGHHRYETACNYRDQVAASRTLAAE